MQIIACRADLQQVHFAEGLWGGGVVGRVGFQPGVGMVVAGECFLAEDLPAGAVADDFDVGAGAGGIAG